MRDVEGSQQSQPSNWGISYQNIAYYIVSTLSVPSECSRTMKYTTFHYSTVEMENNI